MHKAMPHTGPTCEIHFRMQLTIFCRNIIRRLADYLNIINDNLSCIITFE